MCERFGWTEKEYDETSRKTLIEFTLILRTLDKMAQEEAKKAQQEQESHKPHVS